MPVASEPVVDVDKVHVLAWLSGLETALCDYTYECDVWVVLQCVLDGIALRSERQYVLPLPLH